MNRASIFGLLVTRMSGSISDSRIIMIMKLKQVLKILMKRRMLVQRLLLILLSTE